MVEGIEAVVFDLDGTLMWVYLGRKRASGAVRRCRSIGTHL